MNEQYVLMGIMGGLALIEIGLIISVLKLRHTLLTINEKVKRFEKKVEGITDNIKMVYDLIKPASKMLENGSLEVHGKTPIGPVDLTLKFEKKKDEESSVEKSNRVIEEIMGCGK